MSFLKGVTLKGLDAGAGFALWSFRAIASGGGGCCVLRRGFDSAFGDAAAEAFDAMHGFARVLGHGGGRRILLAAPGCCRVTADEASVVGALAAAQRQDVARCSAHLAWLTAGREEGVALNRALRVGSVFSGAGIEIVAPPMSASAPTRSLVGAHVHPPGRA